MKTYEEFKTFLKTFLWRPNDKVLIDNLDSLITMANAELNRRLKIQDREEFERLSVTSEDFVLPTDFHAVRGVSSPNLTDARGQDWGSRTPSQLRSLRAATQSNSVVPTYAIRNKTLMVCGPFTEDNPYDIDLEYWAKVPDYIIDDSSWLEEDYLDLYTYAVLKQSAMFIREDDRLNGWIMLFTEALDTALEDDAHNRLRGISEAVQPPAQSSTRGRSVAWKS